MPFPFDEYPWAKFEDLNLAYMIHRLGLIITAADAKLAELDEWKTATEQDLENWKNSTMDLIAEWEHDFMAEVNQWEHDTEQNLAQWKTDTLEALDTWKAAATAAFEAIRVQAAGSATAAAASASQADTARAAAISAQTAAEQAAASITASALQITTNSNRIDELAELFTFGKNLYNPDSEGVLHNKYMNISGVISDYNNRTVTDYMPVVSGKKLVVSRLVNGVQEAFTWSATTFFDAEKNVVTGGTYNQSGVEIPAGVAFVRATFSSTYPDVQFELCDDTSFTAYEPYTVTLSDAVIIPAVEDLEEITEETTRAIGGERVNLITADIEPFLRFSQGYMAQSGAISYASSLCYSAKIPVSPGDILTSGGSTGFRFITAFDDNGPVSALGAANVLTYTVPANINAIIITAYYSHLGEKMLLKTTPENYARIAVKKIGAGYMSEARGAISSGSIVLPQQNIANGVHYVFNALVDSMGTIAFTKGTQCAITVTTTTITVKNDLGQSTSYAHGLSIDHDLTLEIIEGNSINLEKLRLMSKGAEYSVPMTPAVRFNAKTGAPTMTITSCVLRDAKFSWTAFNADKSLWLFGDSYVSWYQERWIYHAEADDNLESSLVNGYAGQNTQNALISLKALLAVHRPKTVVWMIGMNDADSSNAVNASWLTGLENLKQLSKTFGFELVLYTVPTTPTVNNNFKNEIIRASGYRYIEADEAVRINSSGDWVEGALSSDNVHPTAVGAKIIYHRILADLPEIACK